MIPPLHPSARLALWLPLVALGTTACSRAAPPPTATAPTAEYSALAAEVRARALGTLVAVKGGTFQMGDFGPLIAETGGGNYSMDDNNKPLHTVELSPFRLQAYRVTQRDYDDYLQLTGRADLSYHRDPSTIPANLPGTDPDTRWPDEAVTVDWHEASAYCHWLGEQIDLPGQLPTEAQWEYAARAEGQLLPIATDNGQIEEGRNAPSSKQTYDMHPEDHWNETIRVGRFPPNPLGLFDLSYGGLEWIQDWYAADYYAHSPGKDPQGPANGKERVQRGKKIGESGYGMTDTQLVFIRFHRTPDYFEPAYNEKLILPGMGGIRCAFTPPRAP